jgi:hypothetical protein
MLTLLVLALVAVVYCQQLNLVLLSDSLKDGAACLDGSAPAYYYRPGTGTGVNKWLLFHEGGGWCTSLNDCLGRSKTTLGSSKTYPATANENSGYFSTSATVNPLMYNWNVVYFKYCDGASFSGNNDTVTPVNGTPLYWRGYRNLLAYLKDLNTKRLQAGTDFVISGCSAGGLATYLHVDWWKQQVPATATVRGMPDSGYFLDYDSTGRVKYATDMRWVFTQQNCTSGVNQDCIAAHQAGGDTYLCFFAEHTTPYIKTPIFPLQSRYDSWQVGNILGTNETAAVNTYGTLFAQRFQAVEKNPNNGYFFDSCYHHCGEWDSIRIDNTLSGAGVAGWYNKASAGKYIQENPYPCATCCKP